MQTIAIAWIIPVSYTHLDVYKRQDVEENVGVLQVQTTGHLHHDKHDHDVGDGWVHFVELDNMNKRRKIEKEEYKKSRNKRKVKNLIYKRKKSCGR